MFNYDELVATCYILYGGKITPKIIIEFLKIYQLIKKEPFKRTKLNELKGTFYTEEDGTWSLVNGKTYADILPYLNINLVQILYGLEKLKDVEEGPISYENLRNLISSFEEEKGFQKTLGGLNES